MTEAKNQPDFPLLEPLRRYVPLVAWIIAILVLLVIPLKILSYGYLPQDDALRAAGKAVSGKTWQEILVLKDVYKIDHEYGWSLVLSKVHTLFNADPETIVMFSVVSLFVLVSLAAMLWLRYPEAWLAALVLSMVTVILPFRFLLGRPYLITAAALVALLFLWRRFGAGKPKPWMAGAMTALITSSVYFHGTWYLWALPITAFFLARQFRWAFTLAGCWVVGVFFGSLLTGHLIEYPLQAVHILQMAVGKHLTQRTLAAELQPQNGDVHALYILGGLLLLRRMATLNAPPFSRDPVFWLVCICWVLAFKAARFWMDWGWPALLVMVASDLQLLLTAKFALDSFRRLALVAGIALIAFLSITSDFSGLWTNNLTQQFLSESEHPELKGWMPEKGGILYSTDMETFYQTFYKNPHGDWRYILGFEPALMPDEDFAVYHRVLWNYGGTEAYTPWVLKMKSADRLVIREGRDSPPYIRQLDWYYSIGSFWIGRLPGHETNGVPPTISATAKMSSLTNSTPELPN